MSLPCSTQGCTCVCLLSVCWGAQTKDFLLLESVSRQEAANRIVQWKSDVWQDFAAKAYDDVGQSRPSLGVFKGALRFPAGSPLP